MHAMLTRPNSNKQLFLLYANICNIIWLNPSLCELVSRWNTDSRNLAATILPSLVFPCASFHSCGPGKKAQSNLAVAAAECGHHALWMDTGKGTFPAKKFKAPAKSQRGKEDGIPKGA